MTTSFQGWELVALALSSLVSSWVTCALSLVVQAIKRLTFQERVYTDDLCKIGLLAVVDRVRSLYLFSERHEVIGTTMQPAGIVIGATFVAHVENVPTTGFGICPRMRVRVVRWRWMPPLVPDDACAQDLQTLPEGVIRVLRKSKDNRSGWRMRVENACPAAVPRDATANARATASQIVALRKGESQIRVLISGRPGCGKSTTAREVARMIGGVLVPGFDPSRPGHGMEGVLEAAQGVRIFASSSPTPIVISMDEVDVCLRRAIAGMPYSPGGGGGGGGDSEQPDVTDKTSWNAMLDMLQFVPDVMLVMSTNSTFAELDALDATGAMLRAGRVTHRIALGDAHAPPADAHIGNNKRNKMKRRGPTRPLHP